MLAVNREFDGMRYFFHFVWAEDAVKDEQGVELEGLRAAYWHAIDMVHRVRVRFPDAGNDWLIEIADETDRRPLVVLPAGVSALGRPSPLQRFSNAPLPQKADTK
jgi:hypothetical protein